MEKIIVSQNIKILQSTWKILQFCSEGRRRSGDSEKPDRRRSTHWREDGGSTENYWWGVERCSVLPFYIDQVFPGLFQNKFKELWRLFQTLKLSPKCAAKFERVQAFSFCEPSFLAQLHNHFEDQWIMLNKASVKSVYYQQSNLLVFTERLQTKWRSRPQKPRTRRQTRCFARS